MSVLLSGTAVAATFPIKVSDTNPRLLVDQSNIPVLLIADAPHSLLVNLDDAGVALYLADRATNGFNSLWVQLLCDAYTFGPTDPDDGRMLDGTTPFTVTLPGGYWDLTTPNEAFFARVDKIIRMAGSNGMQILLTPFDTGGWMDTALANGTNRCRQYGQYLGERYQGFANLIWQHGNDFQTWAVPENDAVISAIALGIRERDSNHLQSVQLDYSVSASLDDPRWWPIASYDSVYTYLPTYDKVLTEYQRTNRIPIWMIEGHYEFEELQGELGTPAVLRRQTYWALTSGAIGYGYGSGYTDSFQAGWQMPGNLDTVGVAELNYATALFRSRAWYDFVPDTNHTILTAGYGTYETGGNVGGNDYATCARDKHGHTVVVYAPTQRTMRLDLSQVSGTSANAWWYDPRRGVATNFATYATSGTQEFTPPNANDWVLVLDDAAQSYPPPGAAPLIFPLEITMGSLRDGQTGVWYSVQCTLRGGTAPYHWGLAPGSGPLPGGLDLSADGVLSGTPTVSGTFAFTVRATDSGTMTANQSLTLYVNGLNTPPTITGIADQTIDEDTATDALNFTLGDGESNAGGLTLSKGSSNPALVPTNNIVFGGSGANRTVTVIPAANQSGVATITVGVSDGQLSASQGFVVTVRAVNDAPTITSIGDQAIGMNRTAGPLGFAIGDVETAVDSLGLSAGTSDPVLVPTNNIVFGGSGANRTVTVSPAANRTGTAVIKVIVSDGLTNTSTSFVVAVSSVIATTTRWTNAGAITIPSQGPGTPYPSTIPVTGLKGAITNVTVSLLRLTHTWKADLDILLQSPGGQKVILMSDAGGAYTGSGSVTVTFSDGAADYLPASNPISSGTYRPTDYAPSDTFPAPAPGGPYGTNLAGINGSSANGVWSLYVLDDGQGDFGSLTGGWSLTLTTVSAASAAPTISAIADLTTRPNQPTAPIAFTIDDADTAAASLTLSGGSSNPALVPTNNIVFGGSGRNRTITVSPAANQVGSATITVSVSDGENSAHQTFLLTIRPPAVSLGVLPQTSEQIASNGFRFYITFDSPATLVVEYTTDFSTWQQIGTAEYTDHPLEMLDPNAGQSAARFYRVRKP